MFLSLDGTFWVQLANFVIFFALLNAIFLRPVGNAIAKRRQYIKSVTVDYDRYCEEAAQFQAQADAIRAAARREAEQLLHRTRGETSNETAQIAGEYGRRAAETIAAAHATVQTELNEARAHEDRLVGDLATEMAERAVAETAA
ncbi:MAG: hypothetical protein JOZ38_05120 [Candidatus Eremiobacteraeota bacterium]|nr:hypothetical protein [Candidatus Eremiobacteraeota bacterium]